MKPKTRLFLTPALLALLLQAGCSTGYGPSQESAPPKQGAMVRGGNPVLANSSGMGRSGNIGATFPEGSPFVVRTTTAMSSNTQVAGQTFTAHLEQPLLLDGREIVARGAEVEGTIVESDKGGRVKGLATLGVQMTRLHTGSGSVVDISTGTVTRMANTTKKKDALKIGIGSGVGAAIGAIVGGGKGAAIGAAAGAGAGTGAVLVTHGDAAVIPSETVLQFALKSPVTIAALR